MSNLLNAFDFDNVRFDSLCQGWVNERNTSLTSSELQPDYSIPELPSSPYPYTEDGLIVGTYVLCEAIYSDVDPTVPYGNQTLEEALYFEDGFKQVYGALNEGHFLVFEANGYAIANSAADNTSSAGLTATSATADHEDPSQRWILHAISDLDEDFGKFEISSAVDGTYLTTDASLTSDISSAGTYSIAYIGNGLYTLDNADGKFLSVAEDGQIELSDVSEQWQIFSVTYHT